MLKIYIASLILAAALIEQISGHGMMLEPPNRSSVWRSDNSAPPNYNDNGLFCGGRQVQWDRNAGKCGLCGDAYDLPHPQPNENTGTYGQGKVVRTYTPGSVIQTKFQFQPGHKGYFNFSLCVLQNPNAPEPGESCFQPLHLGDGSAQYNMIPEEGAREVETTVKLPDGLRCERCVLRWHYRAGNQWGKCDDGTEGLGCGPQENYRNCADIAIR